MVLAFHLNTKAGQLTSSNSCCLESRATFKPSLSSSMAASCFFMCTIFRSLSEPSIFSSCTCLRSLFASSSRALTRSSRARSCTSASAFSLTRFSTCKTRSSERLSPSSSVRRCSSTRRPCSRLTVDSCSRRFSASSSHETTRWARFSISASRSLTSSSVRAALSRAYFRSCSSSEMRASRS